MNILEFAESEGYTQLTDIQKEFLLKMQEIAQGTFAPIDITGIEPTCDKIYNQWQSIYRHVSK